MSNVHDGHRSRLKERYREQGLDTFSDLNALELLLFYAIPRGDVNPLAHRLLDRFQTLSGVMDASVRELCQVDGVGDNTALLLKLVPEMSRRYRISRNGEHPVLDTARRAGEFIVPFFHGQREERLYLITLDPALRVIAVDLMAEGIPNEVTVHTRKFLEICLNRKASRAMLAHNHPSGNPLPSSEDEAITRELRLSLRMVGVELVDHLIVADDMALSMMECGYMPT